MGGIAGDAFVVEETLEVGSLSLRVARPADPEALLDEEAFEHEEFMPYWAELWPSSLALAEAVLADEDAVRGRRVLELGCGLGIPSIAAALAGGRVLATDWSEEAVSATARNAELNGARLETALARWDEPAVLVDRAPWDLVLASDVLYERRNAEQLLELLPRLVDVSGAVWLAEPGRPASAGFLEEAARSWTLRSSPIGGTRVVLHRLSA